MLRVRGAVVEPQPDDGVLRIGVHFDAPRPHPTGLVLDAFGIAGVGKNIATEKHAKPQRRAETSSEDVKRRRQERQRPATASSENVKQRRKSGRWCTKMAQLSCGR